MVSLSRHSPSKLRSWAPPFCTLQGVLTSFILALLVFIEPHVLYVCLPVAFVESLSFSGNLGSRQKQLNWGFVLLCFCTSPFPSIAHCSLQPRPCVAIDYSSVFLSPASTFHSSLWAEREQWHREKREKVVTKFRAWNKQAPGYTANQPVRETCNFPPKARCLE